MSQILIINIPAGGRCCNFNRLRAGVFFAEAFDIAQTFVAKLFPLP
jgi:hypothetical protein